MTNRFISCQLTELIVAAGDVYLHIGGHIWLSREEHHDQLMMSVLGGRGGHTSIYAMYLLSTDRSIILGHWFGSL